MSVPYKLTYFDIYGVAEPIRLLFCYRGLKFEDNRIKGTDWDQLKPKTPYGKLPLLEHNGKLAHQSISVARYLGKVVGLVGNNYWEDLQIDSTVDTVNDLREKIFNYYLEKDPKIKKDKEQIVSKETLPFFLKKLDISAKENNGHLVLGRLTWADFYFVGLLDVLNIMMERDILAGYSNLQNLRENIISIPNINKWMQKRPKCSL